MEQQRFSIEALELTTAQRYAIQGAATRALQACRVEISPDETKEPLELLGAMEEQLERTDPDILGDTKETILDIAAGIPRSTITNRTK